MKSIINWVDDRLPVVNAFEKHLSKYYTPKNFNFWYFFGSLALLVLVSQIVTGIFLTMHYKPDAALAFASVEYIMREVPGGAFIRYMHSTGASAFFVVIYLHMFRGLIYGSYKAPRELIWIFGMFIYLALMAEAFMGYLLPWGQMSYWGGQVIINLFGTIPVIGDDLALWIRGDYVVGDATLNRFFALHVVAVPFAIVGLVAAHILALHEVGSNNPDGVEIKKDKDANGVPKDGVPFHPYFTIKDIFGASIFFIFFFAVVFFAPEMGGYFLEHPNFEPANPLKTPEHIAPVWYFTPFYTILRSVPDPFLGFVAMGLATVILFFLPWLDRNPIKSWRYRSFLFKASIVYFIIIFFILGYLGVQPVTDGLKELGVRCTEVYFMFFATLVFNSRQRSSTTSFIWFAVLMGLVVVYDITRLATTPIDLLAIGLLMPLSFLAMCLLGPVFTNLGAEKQVPKRVTVK